MVEHNCIKQCFERDKCLTGSENLREALAEGCHYIKKPKDEKLEVLKSSGLNSWKAIIFKKYRQNVDAKWKDVTCPEPSMKQCKAYNEDTTRKYR